MLHIGRYEVIEELGRGAMGVVYRARDPQIDRIVAIKVILSANALPEELDRYKQRFQREARAAGRMSHAGIITIHDFAEDETGHPYLVMEFVEGTPLDKLLAPPVPRPPLEKLLDIAIQVAQALDYAHRRGVIHRDIKPANILVTREGQAKIADFGIAKLAGSELTQEGSSLGTPAFMSPEQFSGTAVDGRSDIFSFGAVLYWMCTGEKPFAGDTLTAVSFKIVYAAPILAHQLNPALPASLDAVLGRCLAKQPDQRYKDCSEVVADLEALKSGRPVSAGPVPAAPMERTMPLSVASSTSSGAVSHAKTIGISAAEGLGASSRPATRGRGLLPRMRDALRSVGNWPKAWVAAAVVLLLLALGSGVGYWLRSRGEAETSAGETTPSEGTSRTADRGAAPRVLPPRGREPGNGTRRAAPSSTLWIVCEHNFRQATIEIFSDDQPLLDSRLHGEEQDYGVMKIYEGKLETSRPIPAGRHTLRVHVSSRSSKFEDEAEISGTFAEDGSRTLVVEFGKGSALGVVGRKIILSWR